jgi:hypothetical protein
MHDFDTYRVFFLDIKFKVDHSRASGCYPKLQYIKISQYFYYPLEGGSSRWKSCVQLTLSRRLFKTK